MEQELMTVDTLESVRTTYYVPLGEIESSTLDAEPMQFQYADGVIPIPQAVKPLMLFLENCPSVWEFVEWSTGQSESWNGEDVTTELLSLGAITTLSPSRSLSEDFGRLLCIRSTVDSGVDLPYLTGFPNLFESQLAAEHSGVSHSDFIRGLIEALRCEQVSIRYVKSKGG
jgi:hypothetical protein